jgi:curli production assembly/transport component CsgG
MNSKVVSKIMALLMAISLLGGCAAKDALVGQGETAASLTPRSSSYVDLISLPKPKGKIVTAVYSFRDQTGQYKPVPASNFSTAVTQGATSFLVTALRDSGWFIPVEREGLQNLLTERKIIRATEKNINEDFELPPLMPATIVIEGGIVGYDSNTKTGGAGARYLGVGGSEQYRQDQVTINLRMINTRTGEILDSVMTTKTVFSREVQSGVFRFVEYKELLEIEAGMTTNEPIQVCVMSAIETAVIHLIGNGLKNKNWQLADSEQISHVTLQKYLNTDIPVLE